MRTSATTLVPVTLLAALSGCTPAESPSVATPQTPLTFHYMDDVGNCSLYFQLTSFQQFKAISDGLEPICNPSVFTCRDWIEKRADVGDPATHPRRSRILERSLHHHLSKTATTSDNWWLDVPEQDELALWMDSYCSVNPENYTVQGAHKFVAEQLERERKEESK